MAFLCFAVGLRIRRKNDLNFSYLKIYFVLSSVKRYDLFLNLSVKIKKNNQIKNKFGPPHGITWYSTSVISFSLGIRMLYCAVYTRGSRLLKKWYINQQSGLIAYVHAERTFNVYLPLEVYILHSIKIIHL